MNVKHKTEILLANGYKFERRHDNLIAFYEWRSPKGQLVACESRNVVSTNIAYKHLVRKLSMITTVEDEYDRAQLEAKQASVVETVLEPVADTGTLEAETGLEFVTELEAENAALHKENQTLLIAIADLAKQIAKINAEWVLMSKLVDEAMLNILANYNPISIANLTQVQKIRVMRSVLGTVTERLSNALQFSPDDLKLKSEASKTGQASLSTPAPKFKIGDKVLYYLRRGTVVNIRQHSLGNEYRLEYDFDGISVYWYHESQLEGYKPLESESK